MATRLIAIDNTIYRQLAIEINILLKKYQFAQNEALFSDSGKKMIAVSCYEVVA